MRILLLALTLCLGCATATKSPTPGTQPRQTAVVELVKTNHVAMFWGEREMLRRAVADHLKRQSSLRLQPLPDLEQEVLRAQLAKDRAECGAPTRPSIWMAAQHPDAVYVRTTASCVQRPCTINVRVERPPTGGKGPWTVLERWTTPVQNPTTTNQWINAVGSLVPLPSAKTAAAGMLTGSSSPDGPKVRVLGVSTVHPWAAPPTVTMITRAQDALDACHRPGWSSAGTDHVAVEVSPQGRVARCEGASHREQEDGRRLKCVCQAVSKLPFGRGPRGRRFEIQLLNRPVALNAPKEGASVRLIEATHQPGFDPRPELAASASELLGCLPETAMQATMQAKFQVSGQGQLTQPQISGVPQEVAACAAEALRRVKLPCTAERKSSRGQASFDLRVH